MHKNKVLIVLFWACAFPLFSQITQTTTLLNVCDNPAVVTYSAPAGTSVSNWTLGAPSNTSSLPNGSWQPAVGTYTILFSGIVNGNNTTFSAQLIVHPKPVANFSISQPANSCVVKTVTLTDQSTTTSTINAWFWTYGDGGSGSFPGTHAYGYTIPGTFSVTLKVTDVYGCTNQVTKGTVSVSPTPTAVISSNPQYLYSCSASMSVVFSASNSLGTGLTYNWDFGNSQSGAQVTSGSITYTTQNNPYLVTLTVSSGGCSSVKSVPVTVRQPTLQVTTPGTVCLNAVPVATLFSNQPYSQWDMGNSNKVVIFTPPPSVPVFTLPPYTVPGVYTITIDGSSGACPMTPVTRTITVEKVVASFSATAPYSTCQKSLNALYTNLSSTNATQYFWRYFDHNGNLVTSTIKNPAFTFSYQTQSMYTHDSLGFRPTVTLTAVSPSGCSADTSLQLHVLLPPTAWFLKNIRQGCAPLNVMFYNQSFSLPAHTITSYTWVSNIGNPTSSVSGTAPPIPNNTFTYSTPGIYRPYLIVQAGGCIDTSFVDTVIVADPPLISFSVQPAQVCPSDSVQIINTSPSQNNISHWHVESDNGFFSHCVNDANPYWKFTHTGLHTFTLSGYVNGCKGSAVSTQSVLVRGPVVRSRYETNCAANRLNVNFVSHLQEVQTLTVNFGDGSGAGFPNTTGLSSVTVAHTYSASGDYTVTFVATNAGTGCLPSTHTLLVKVRDVQATFNVPSLICSFVPTSIDASASIDVLTGCLRGFVWFVDDLPPFETELPYGTPTFSSGGTHTVTLLVKDVNSCTDTATRTFTVSDANSAFLLSSNRICLSNGTLQITNTTPQVPDPIVSFFWNFGDGSTLNTTSQVVPLKTYNFAASPYTTFTISLTATNDKGCVKTVTDTVQVINPDATFNAQPRSFCISPGTQSLVTFTAMNSFPSYTYNFGLSQASTLTTGAGTVAYAFPPGVRIVTLQASDTDGCIGTDTLLIEAQLKPVADFLVSTPGSTAVANVLCLPGSAKFVNLSEPKPLTPIWDLGAGAVLPIDTVYHSYPFTTTTVVPVSLTVTAPGPNACSASVTKNFTVYVSKAEIALSKTLVCVGQEINFSIDTTQGGSVKHWIWDFADFSPSDTLTAGSAPPFVPHRYTSFNPAASGNLTVSLIYWNEGKTCSYVKQKPIRVIRVKADFLRNADTLRKDTIHCLNTPDRFTNISETDDSAPLVFRWGLPGGISSADSSLSHTFQTPGVHQVSLTAINQAQGCSYTAIKNMTIVPQPTAAILPDDYCPGVPFTITVSTSPGVTTGTWSPAENIISPVVFSVKGTSYVGQAQANASTQFTLVVTDSTSCISEPVTGDINVLLPPRQIMWDTTVVIGEPVPINGRAGTFAYDYVWTPVAGLSCSNCPSPVSNTTVDILYTVHVEDYKGCASVDNQFRIFILPKASIDLPTAFTPNGDGINDIIYVGGWGIKKLNFFRIYNRWGQLIFETNDLSQGWDGYFNGVRQPVETYVYQVSVDTYVSDEPLSKSSTFKLLR